jgi:hypothetical protein
VTSNSGSNRRSGVEQVLLEQLFPEPDRERHRERREAAEREGEVRLEQPLELEEGLVVEGHVVDVAHRHPSGVQTVRDRLPGEPGVVLLTTVNSPAPLTNARSRTGCEEVTRRTPCFKA